MRYVALLRGVNLGRSTTIRMAELGTVLAGAGLENVSTYVGSGNVIVDGGGRTPQELRQQVEQAIADHWGRAFSVVVRSAAEMQAVSASNPYPRQAEADPTKVHAMFLSEQPPAQVWDGIDLAAVAPDELTVGERVVYLHLPDGMGRSRLFDPITRLKLGVVATTRNWRTVTKLVELVGRSQP